MVCKLVHNSKTINFHNMSNRIPSQETFFYKSNWTPEVDIMLLTFIIRMKNDFKVDGNVLPIHFFQKAASEIAEELGVHFSWSELYERFQSFEQRFILFDDVVNIAGVSWNVNFNTMAAATPVWESILKVLLWYGSKLLLILYVYFLEKCIGRCLLL